MRKLLLFLLLIPLQVHAGDTCIKTTAAPNYSVYGDGTSVNCSIDANGNIRTTTAGGGGSPSNATIVGGTITGTPTTAAVSCASTSTTALAAAAASIWEHFENPGSNTVSIWVSLSGAATAAAPSIELQTGQSADFFATSFLPTAQINCISTTGTNSLTVIYK